VEFRVEEGGRLDRVLAQAMGESRNQVERLIKGGHVAVDGQKVQKGGAKVKQGSLIRVQLPQPEEAKSHQPVDFPIERLYEDEGILVISKPPGVVVHPAPSFQGPTLVDWLQTQGIRLSTLNGQERHGIVHRLDKETSGVMVIAKENRAHAHLAQQLQNRTMGRYYLAIITPPLKEDLIIERPLGRNPRNRLKMGVVAGGRYAKSAFKKLLPSSNGREELIAAKLFTGRTHQIRAHLASIQRHILGDSLYGFKSQKGTIGRVYLHAYILYLVHPYTQEPMRFVAPLAPDMAEYLQTHFDVESLDATIDPATFERHFAHLDRWLRRDTAPTGQT